MTYILEVDIPMSINSKEEEPAVAVLAKRASRSSVLGMKIIKASVSAPEREIDASVTAPEPQTEQQSQLDHHSGPGTNVHDRERKHEHKHGRQPSQTLSLASVPLSFIDMHDTPSSMSSLKGGLRAPFN